MSRGLPTTRPSFLCSNLISSLIRRRKGASKSAAAARQIRNSSSKYETRKARKRLWLWYTSAGSPHAQLTGSLPRSTNALAAAPASAAGTIAGGTHEWSWAKTRIQTKTTSCQVRTCSLEPACGTHRYGTWGFELQQFDSVSPHRCTEFL